MLSNSILRGCIVVKIKYMQGFFGCFFFLDGGARVPNAPPLAMALYSIIVLQPTTEKSLIS